MVATPIGNLADLSHRAADVLQQVDLIAAEDTRHSRKLLTRYHIDTPLTALHEHNELAAGDKLVAQLSEGKTIALISDAGTPLISDPGYRLVCAARDQGIPVTPVPGACAAIAALSVAALPSDRFCFEGFLPAKSPARKKVLRALYHEQRTMIFYESPHRILTSLLDFADVFGELRRMTVARELTKKFETVFTGSATDVVAWLNDDPKQQQGEFVLVVEGGEPAPFENQVVDTERLLKVLIRELPVKKAAALVADLTGLPKNELYRLALSLKSD